MFSLRSNTFVFQYFCVFILFLKMIKMPHIIIMNDITFVFAFLFLLPSTVSQMSSCLLGIQVNPAPRFVADLLLKISDENISGIKS